MLFLLVIAFLSAAVAPACAASSRAQLISRMVAWTGVPASAVVAVTADTVVAVARRGAGPAGGEIDGVEIVGEIVDEGLAQARGWRSMRTTLDVSCADRTTRISRMEVFPEHGLAGPARSTPAPKGWAQPSVGAYLADVVTAVCFGGPAAPAPGRRTAASVGLRHLAEAASPPAPPASTPLTSAPQPSTPMSAPPPQASAAPTAYALSPAAAVGPVAQIASALSKGDAQAALAALSERAAIAPPLTTRVETATVHGRLYYRAEVAGFPSIAEASRFCAKVRAAGGGCFVR